MTITGTDLAALNEEEQGVLYVQARYCQAMTDADIGTLREIISEDMIFTHMSGRQQTREEYFADIASGRLKYYTIGIENPEFKAEGNQAVIAYTAVLSAVAYGAKGVYRMHGSHFYERRNGGWIAVNRL
ncbi:MAG: nuclear transport factor 2 family protein [Lachnospiraceae bacterium]|nr:nuclear transport factor 2 family protein [Lachnospiraceae bacterium]